MIFYFTGPKPFVRQLKKQNTLKFQKKVRSSVASKQTLSVWLGELNSNGKFNKKQMTQGLEYVSFDELVLLLYGY